MHSHRKRTDLVMYYGHIFYLYIAAHELGEKVGQHVFFIFFILLLNQTVNKPK